MRSFILGIVILMAVPAYAAGQWRDRSERQGTGRTAVPRGDVPQPAPARQTDRRAEPRQDTETPASPPEGKPDDAAPQRTSRERRNTSDADETRRERARDERPRHTPADNQWTNPGFRRPLNPGFERPLNSGFRPLPNQENRPLQKDGDYRPRYRRQHSGANVVFVPYAAPLVVEREVVVERGFVDQAAAPVIIEQPSLARLILDIQPPTAQIFADGYYIGVPEDFRFENGGALLEPGPHRIDILARDHEPVTFDVNLARGQSATFRHVLTPITRAPRPAPNAATQTPPASKERTTFYLIPGCYMGNVPPKDVNLPATCDVARAVSVQY